MNTIEDSINQRISARIRIERESRSWSLTELAERAGVSRAMIDLKLSSIKRYVEASGGKLRLDVELPDGTHYGFAV